MEEVAEDAGNGGRLGGLEALGIDQSDEGASGAELGHVIVVDEVGGEGCDGVGDALAEIVGDIVPDFVAAPVQFNHEGGVAAFPSVEGFAVDFEGLADEGFVLTGEEAG
jgi:hypothetical protein